MWRQCVKRRKTLRKRPSCSGSYNYAWPWSTFIGARSCIVISNLKTSFSQKIILSSWATSASLQSWQVWIILHFLCRERRTTCPQRFVSQSPTTIHQMYGHSAASSTSYVLFNTLFQARTFSVSSSKLSRTNKGRYPICTRRTWRISSQNFLSRTRRKGLRSWKSCACPTYSLSCLPSSKVRDKCRQIVSFTSYQPQKTSNLPM